MALVLPEFLRRELGRRREIVAAVCGFSIFINLLTLAMPLFTVQLYDRVLVSGSGATLLVIVSAVLAALAVSAVLENIRSRLLVIAGVKFDGNLAASLLERQVEASVRSSGMARGQALRDLDTFRSVLTGSGTLALMDLPWAPIFIIACFFLHPLMGAVCLLGVIMIGGMAAWNQWAVGRPLAESSERGEANHRLTETVLRNAEVVTAMGMLPDLMRRWGATRDGLMERQAVASARNSDIAGVMRFARLALQIAILSVGAWLVVERSMSGGALFAASLLTTRALQPIDQIAGVWRQLVIGWVAMNKISDTLSDAERPRAMQVPAPHGALSVENLSYGPPGASAATVANVSFRVAPGEAVGVVGPSAAGKSTLARLIVGALKPVGGVVRLDEADTYAWDRADFGRVVGYLPQDIELFDGSVRDNIARFRDADPTEIVQAAELAGVHEMILRLPKGYETMIGANGAGLSGGQRQRIALARAVFGDPKLVVFDEPNSNLDGEGEAALQRLVMRLRTKRVTVLLIAHRPSALVSLDKVLILANGGVMGYGPVSEMLPRIAPGYPVPPLRAVQGGAA